MSLAIRVGATTSGRAASFLEVRGLSKSYGATQALRDVSLTIRRGEIHALLGSNGAGKSTLVKIVLGAMRPSGGQILIDGEPVAFRSVKDALAVGIYPIYQHLSQFPHLTVRENMAAFELGTCRNFFLRSALPDDAHIRKHLASVGLDCSLDERVASLSVGQRQLLEIARSLAQNARILVLDEPTAALTRTEAATLLSTLAELRRRGVGILYISHKLEEIVELADRVSVIRDGICSLEGRPMAELSTRDLVTAIVGREVAALRPASQATGCRFRARSGSRGTLSRSVIAPPPSSWASAMSRPTGRRRACSTCSTPLPTPVRPV